MIPVMCTGGAASGKFNVPVQIFKKPLGVSDSDWLTLKNEEASTDQISQSVSTIVETVRDRLQIDSPSVQPEKMHSYFSQTPRTSSSQLSDGMDDNGFTSLRRSPLKRPNLSRDPTVIV